MPASSRQDEDRGEHERGGAPGPISNRCREFGKEGGCGAFAHGDLALIRQMITQHQAPPFPWSRIRRYKIRTLSRSSLAPFSWFHLIGVRLGRAKLAPPIDVSHETPQGSELCLVPHEAELATYFTTSCRMGSRVCFLADLYESANFW